MTRRESIRLLTSACNEDRWSCSACNELKQIEEASFIMGLMPGIKIPGFSGIFEITKYCFLLLILPLSSTVT
jgi:hypothetical protein